MIENKSQQQSQLIGVLREGIGVVQMVLFKELRTYLAAQYPDWDITRRSMLVGAIINKIFGQENPEEKFRKFNEEHRAIIEQEMLGLAQHFAQLKDHISDALRVHVLCDNQEGEDSSAVLQQALELNLLVEDRDIPLPSTFMTSIRKLGEEHGLTVAPIEISEDDDSLIH